MVGEHTMLKSSGGVAGTFMDSISIIVSSYAFIINFFPIYSSLEKRSNTNGIMAAAMALLFCFIVYISFSFLAYYSYGENLNANIFENIQREQGLASIFIRVLFLVIFLCNIPFIFLPGKEAFLIMVDEFMTRSMSLSLMKRIDQINNGLLNYPNDTANQTSYLLLNFKEEDNDELKASKISEKVSNLVYYTSTVSLFTLQMICAVLIDDVTIIFGFFAAISESMINFFIPASFYLISCKIAKVKPNPYLKIGSYIFLLLGLTLFITANYHNISKFNKQ